MNTAEKIQGIGVYKNGELVAFLHKDMKLHKQIFFNCSESNEEDIMALINPLVDEVPFEQEFTEE